MTAAKGLSCDESIRYSWHNSVSFAYDNYNRYTGMDVGIKAFDKANAGDGQPYAMVDMDGQRQYFYKDSFAEGYNRYVWGNYLDNFTHAPYEYAEKGSILLSLLDLFKNRLRTIDADWLNGKPIYMLDPNVTATEIMEAARFDFDLIGQTAADFTGATATYSQETVSGKTRINKVSLVITFKNESLTLACRAESFGLASINPGYINDTKLSAYLYFIAPLVDRFRLYNYYHLPNLSPFKVEIDNTLPEKETAYTMYLTAETVGYDQFYVITADLVDGTKIYKRLGGYNDQRLFKEKGSTVTELTQGGEYDEYRILFDRESILGDNFYNYNLYGADAACAYDKNKNALTITATNTWDCIYWQEGSFVPDGEGGEIWRDGDWVFATESEQRIYTYTLDTALKNIVGFDYKHIPHEGGEANPPEKITISYDFTHTVPFGVLDKMTYSKEYR